MPDPITITVVTPLAGFAGNVGNITVDPTLANFHPGDLVKWNLANATGTKLTISFKTNSPFDAMVLTGVNTIEKGIPAGSPLGVRYHYSVVATVGGTDYVIPGCPEIIVQ